MGLIIAGLLLAGSLWLIGTFLDWREQRRRDIEFFQRWGEKRRP